MFTVNFKWNTRLTIKSLRCKIISENVKTLSQQILLDYVEDDENDENDTSHDKEYSDEINDEDNVEEDD